VPRYGIANALNFKGDRAAKIYSGIAIHFVSRTG
jgi:hypothetical protein